MFLDSIVKRVREELDLKKRSLPREALQDRELFHEIPRGFAKSLRENSRHIIAEVKRASPSQGLIRDQFDPVRIARDFSSHGASALSVLTEQHYFQGCLQYLERVRPEVRVPLLRKDFIVDGYQVLEAKGFGADAILLIAAILDSGLLGELQQQAEDLSLDVLVEVHTENELAIALNARARMVGINNRDLRTFKVSLETTERLMPMIPPDVIVVCESGIETLEQIRKLEGVGVRRFLIGETLMRAADPGAKLKELLRQ